MRHNLFIVLRELFLNFLEFLMVGHSRRAGESTVKLSQCEIFLIEDVNPFELMDAGLVESLFDLEYALFVLI
jgi:hypothetical protein